MRVEFNVEFLEKYCTTKDGLSLYYRDYGMRSSNQKTILCLAGLTRNSHDFDLLAPILYNFGYRLLTMDIRGRGKSLAEEASPDSFHILQYIEDILCLLDQEKIEKTAIIGTSMGGIIGMIMASGFPDRVNALVLNDIGPEINLEGYQLLYQELSKPEIVLSDWDETSLKVKEMLGHVYPDQKEKAFWIRMAKQLCYQGQDHKIRFWYSHNFVRAFLKEPLPEKDLWMFFNTMPSIPVLLVYGELSDFLTSEIRKKMKEERPNMQMICAKRVGHAPELIEPDVLPGLKAFFNQM